MPSYPIGHNHANICKSHLNVTPDDSNDFAQAPGFLFVGNQGDVQVADSSGNVAIYYNYVGWLPVMVSRLYSTNTTATGFTLAY